MAKKNRFFISPFFLFKYYNEKSIRSLLKKYSFNKNILDIGCGEMPYKYLFTEKKEYLGVDFKDYSVNNDYQGETPDLFFPEKYLVDFILPFEDAQFEHAVSFQVLEHVRNPNKFIMEMVRVTKKKGFMLITFPFLGGLHEIPNDYQRYTKYGIKEILDNNGCDVLIIEEQGGIFSTISMLLNEYLNTYAGKSKKKYMLSSIVFPVFLSFSYACLFLDKVFTADGYNFNYLVLARKR